MGVLSNRIAKEDLKPGDHIYSWRSAYIYAHHGIYIGDDKVIHFTRGAGQEVGTGTFLDRFVFSSSSSQADRLCQRCGDQSMLTGVIESCLDCFLSGGDLYLFQYGVALPQFVAQARGGTCTFAASDPTECVLHRARDLLQNGFGLYNIFKNNCEDFAIYCKTGLLVSTNISVGRSGQAASFVAAVTAFVSSPLRFMTTSFTGLSAVAGTVYCLSRIVSDIGVRRDVVKVPVERLIAESVTDGSESGAHMESGQEDNQLLQRLIAGSATDGSESGAHLESGQEDNQLLQSLIAGSATDGSESGAHLESSQEDNQLLQ